MRLLATTPPARRRAPRARDEAGFALIEVVVSALVMVIVGGGALAAMQASEKAVGEQRHHMRAFGIAQDDQARMRSMRISALSNLNQTRTVNSDNTPYTVTSTGVFVTDSTGTASCAQSSASADYIRIGSRVTWPSIGNRPPVLLQSIVAPPNGTISDTHGALAVEVQNGQNQGYPGVALTGSGPSSFSGATGSNGCAIFGNLPAGNYTLTPSGAGLVDRDGDPPTGQTVSVVGLSTNTVVLQYDQAGAVDVSFTTRNESGTVVPSTADSVVVFNTGMTTAEVFGNPGSPVSTLTATQLFPFNNPDTIYAGACTANNPNPFDEEPPPAPAALANVLIPAGGTTTATVQLPALHLTVWSGTPSVPGSPLQNARVRLSDTNCTDGGGQPITRTFFTNPAGKLPDPGLPWSVYDICVDDGTKKKEAAGIPVRNLATGTVANAYMGTAVPGTCA